jgi:hypothetical protein
MWRSDGCPIRCAGHERCHRSACRQIVAEVRATARCNVKGGKSIGIEAAEEGSHTGSGSPAGVAGRRRKGAAISHRQQGNGTLLAIATFAGGADNPLQGNAFIRGDVAQGGFLVSWHRS